MSPVTTSPLAFLDDEIAALKQQKVFRTLFVLEDAQGAWVTIRGKRVLELSANNYLGLTGHPKLRRRALEALERWGVGTGSVRPIAGTFTLHEELEKRLAAFKHTEATLVMQSGFAANLGVIPAITAEDDVIITDELNHASIIDGCRLSKATRAIFPHKDIDAARRLLETHQTARRKLVITDGVFSMDGDIADLPGLASACEDYGAILMVDDAHASGVLGRNGRGTIDHFDLHGRVHIQVGTLSKAIGAMGGYIAGPQSLRDWLIHRGRPFLFSTSHPPSVVAACIAAIEVLETEPELLERLWNNTAYFKQGLRALGFDTGVSETPITPVIVGDEAKTMALSDGLFAESVFAQAIVYPTVPQGKARIRTMMSAVHSRDDLDFALRAFEKVGRSLGIV